MTHALPSAAPPSKLQLLLEIRAAPELGLFALSYPLLSKTAPRGDGHPVMVMPGFLTGDAVTAPLRRFLSSLGYATYGWGQGINYGRGIDPREGVTKSTNVYRKLKYLRQKHGRKVSLIGWSLGGLYARELARLAPDDVRCVITLASPFSNNQQANNAVRAFEYFSGFSLDQIDEKVKARSRVAPPVPSTAIFSRADGVTAWQCCFDEQTDHITENIEVSSSHCGMGHNPAVLYIVADRLAQPVGQWLPYDSTGMRRLLGTR